MGNKAVIVGASGLVGSHLLQLLLQNEQFSEVRSFGRRKLPVVHEKLIQFETNFDPLHDFHEQFTGDIVFCCVGTTIKKAGSQENFRKVDYEIPCIVAQMAEKNHFQTFIVVSSLGANFASSNFYLKTKGQMQQFIEAVNIPRKVFIQPSLLLGKREEFRFGEKFGEVVLRLFGFLLIGGLKKYKAIHSEQVAIAMMKISLNNNVNGIISSDTLKKIAISI